MFCRSVVREPHSYKTKYSLSEVLIILVGYRVQPQD
jgi:hypothetical protein